MNVLDAQHYYFIRLSLLLYTCRAYVDLIDLTNEPPSDQEGEGESSDLDELPLTEVSLSSTYDRYVSVCVQDTGFCPLPGIDLMAFL